MKKKKNMAIFIDGENIPAKKADLIIMEAEKRGIIDFIKVYGLQKDQATRQWTKFAKTNDRIKDIRLCGEPSHNKVDEKIKKDTIRDMKVESNIDIVIIASSDHGYVNNIKELRALGKRVVVIGEAKAPRNLREACNEFVLI